MDHKQRIQQLMYKSAKETYQCILHADGQDRKEKWNGHE